MANSFSRPQVQYAAMLASHLPRNLNSVYFTNSGAEAVEGAMKLAKRVTNRSQIIAFNESYHGSTQGALSIMGSEYWRNAYRPLLPGIVHAEYNADEVLDLISTDTACVVMETVQAENGVQKPDPVWIRAVADRCRQTKALLVLDEIQVAFGRTGTLWGFSQYELVPDILLLGKALGGGMPLGAFIADRETMQSLSSGPVLGHITTFGGHPVCCAAGLAAIQVLLEESLVEKVSAKAQLFCELLQHPAIVETRSAGLLIAVEFNSNDTCKKIIDRCINNGVLTDWFLFAPHCLRIAPPLVISEQEIRRACGIILESVDAA